MIYFYLFLSLTIGFVVSLVIIPVTVKVSVKKKLFDIPDHRSAAKHVVPTLGGIAIFAGFVISQIISLSSFDINELKYMYLGVLIMFILGLKDDLIALSARTKFFVQLAMALYLVLLGNIRITDFHGILGIHEISFVAGVIFSVITIVGIINALNLIDGIDGLASGIGLLISFVYGIWFFYGGEYIYALTSFSLFGSLFAFFIYNVFGTTNKIFMGDTGSLILGTIIALLTIHFNESGFSAHTAQGLPAISLAIIIVPVVDTIRIFVIRLSQGKSPFSPDMNHIHHQVLRLTGSHLKASLIIIAVNGIFILLSFQLIDILENSTLFFFLLVLGFIFAEIPSLVLNILNKQPVEVGFYSGGRVIPVKAEPIFTFASAINKITGNKIANGTQKDNEIQFKRITETVPAGIFTSDAFGAVKYVNFRRCEIAQISADEAMGDGWLKAVHPQDRDTLVLAWRQAISANSSLKTEYRILLPDNSVVWVTAQADPLKNEEGNFVGYTGTIINISEHKKVENELIAQKAKAEESDRLKTAFLNNLNHETRTPLNAIVGFSNLLRESVVTEEDKEKYLKIIEESSIQLLHIINNIIDIALIESGQLKISISEINIDEQIRFIYAHFKEEVQQKGLIFSVSGSPDSSKNMVTDHEKLNAVLTNLVSNAVKYTVKGSIEMGYRINHEATEFFVNDTGIGISKEKQETIFERFIQYDAADKGVQNGLGLGLAISKAYVEILGGKIWVNSEEGKGSTFYFTLPNHSVQKEE